MRAVVTAGDGGPEVLSVGEVADPRPAAGEVLVDVVATAVNRADTLQRQGFYPPPPGASEVIGLECSGRIAELGEGVEGWSVGDEVCALLAGGGYAERVAVPVGQVMPVPSGVSLVEAACLPEVAATVWSNVFMTAHLDKGERFLVHGGGGGIGTMAIQLAAARGAEVYTTAIFGQLDRLLHEPLAQLIGNLPLSPRVSDALLSHIGPYYPLLDIARAQGDADHIDRLPGICEQHEVSLEHANRGLLRMLHRAKPRSWFT